MPMVAVNGTVLAYTETGPASGTPIIFSHSLFLDHTMFDELAAYFSGRGFRVIAYDHRNQGRSAPAAREDLDMDTLTEDAAGLIERLRLNPCHFIGNSLGGFIALRLAARRPDLLLTVCVLGSSVEAEARAEEYQALLDVFGAKGSEVILEVIMYQLFGDTTLALRPELSEPWRKYIRRLPRSINDSAFCVIHRSAISDELTHCKVPVLAIAGDEDHTYPQPISGQTIAAATGGTEVTIEGAGHTVALERPDLVAHHLLRHFTAAETQSENPDVGKDRRASQVDAPLFSASACLGVSRTDSRGCADVQHFGRRRQLGYQPAGYG